MLKSANHNLRSFIYSNFLSVNRVFSTTQKKRNSLNVKMSRTGSIEKRPDPPSVSAMMEDIEATGGDDILFKVMTSFTDEDLSPCDSSIVEPILEPASHRSATSTPNRNSNKDYPIESTYDKVQRLIELQDSLVTGGQKLQQDYKLLEIQGENVSQSLAEFREKAKAIIK